MNEYVFEELELGFKRGFSVVVTETMMESFKVLSGDQNSLHMDREYALSLGFKDRVVFGLLTGSFYSQLVGMELPGKYAIMQGIDIKFAKPVFVGDKLTIEGEVTYKNDILKVIEVKALIVNQDQTKVSSAKINIGLLK